MAGSGHQVGQEERHFPLRFDLHALVKCSVTTRYYDGHTFNYLYFVPIHKIYHPKTLQREEVVGYVRTLGPLIGVCRISPLTLLYHILGPGKGRDDAAIVSYTCIPSGMVQMEVGVYDYINVLGGKTIGGKRSLQRRIPVNHIDVSKFLVTLIAYAGVHQDVGLSRLYKQGAEGEEDSVFIIRRVRLLPQHSRHDPKHSPTVQTEETVHAGMYRELPQPHVYL